MVVKSGEKAGRNAPLFCSVFYNMLLMLLRLIEKHDVSLLVYLI